MLRIIDNKNKGGEAMPYIDQEIRETFDPFIKEIVERLKSAPSSTVAGVLNYIITKLVVSLWSKYKSYSMGNVIIGALQCAGREFARRHLDEYENIKIQENGDVSPF